MSINLLPWREGQIKKRMHQYFLFLFMSIGIIFIFSFFIIRYLNHLNSDYTFRNNNLSKKINEINFFYDSKKLEKDYQIYFDQIKLIKKINLNQNNFWKEFNFFQQNLPKDIQITHLAWIGEELRLQGTTSFPEHIGAFMKSIEKSLLFSHVILENIDREDQSLVTQFAIHVDRPEESIS